MKKLIILGFLCNFFVVAQNPKDSIKFTQLNEIILSSKVVKDFDNLPNQVELIERKEIEFQNFQTTAEMLSNSGKLFVQKSQQGGGSPVIRGFEASRVLLVVDGIRMNNLIFRSGHLQNVITVDENMLENVGVFYGPSSTLFGSDALGGTVTMNTKKAKYFSQTNKKLTGSIISRFGSVNEEKSVALDLNYSLENFAALTVFSFNDFGDLRMGKQKNRNGDFFGARLFYVKRINGQDQLIQNDNKYIQIESAYKQYNLLQKFSYLTKNNTEHLFNFQLSTTNNVPRYDRLTDQSGNGDLRFAEWYYGPQFRLLAIYTLEKKRAFFNSDLQLNFSFQDVKESRHNRRFQNDNLQNREEHVRVYSTSLDLEKKVNNGEIFYGYESYFETVASNAYRKNIVTGLISGLDTRYPNGRNNMFRNDVYFSYNNNLSNKTFLNFGTRVGYTTLQSNIDDDTFFPLPYNAISQSNFTYSANLGINYKTSDFAQIKANLSSGFRVPNIDDVGKIFDSGGGFIVVPNKNLEPEKTITIDFGFKIKSPSKKIMFETTYYFTRMIDAIVTDNFTYEGQSQIVYDGNLSQVIANQNKGKAFVTGISSNFFTNITNKLDLQATFNYTYGRIIEESNFLPLDHIPPYYGKISFNYKLNRLQLEASMLYNGKKDIKDYYLNGEDNEQYAPKGGMPAWEIFNLKSSFTIFKDAIIYSGIENILDTQYRVFASGINAPGRNIYGGIQYRF